MQAYPYYLRPRAAFHLGIRGVGLEATALMAPADTLFSALCATILELYGVRELERMLDQFPTQAHPEQRPPFTLSAGMPYAGSVRLYPRPAAPVPGLEHDESEQKRQKKIAFVSETLFRAWVSGGDVAQYYPRLPKDRQSKEADSSLLQGGQVWVSPIERDALAALFEDTADGQIRLWAEDDVTRVTVDRATNASVVYQVGRVRYAPGAGIYLLLAWRDDETAAEWQPKLWSVMRALGDRGIGGERSSGLGLFEPQKGDAITLPDLAGYERWITLSNCWPLAQERGILTQGAAYHLEHRRGWMDSPAARNLRRKAIHLLAPGSILHAVEGRDRYGALADVTPEGFTAHHVYRYGLAFAVGYGRPSSPAPLPQGEGEKGEDESDAEKGGPP